ncbi:MAG TPA: HK97 family phage prohead protease [Sphingomonas sp.]|nr:HK97 family phage prohead protease [Sphingomonas sp.]
MTRFAGYAAVFDHADRSGDVIRPGAFASAQKHVPLLWEHGGRVGSVERVEEDGRGLRVIGAVGKQVAPGMGLSIGYRVRAARDLPLGRELLDLELIEVSLVRFPMQPLARVLAVEGGADAPTPHPAQLR